MGMTRKSPSRWGYGLFPSVSTASAGVTTTLPNGDHVLARVAYTAEESAGVTSLVIASCLSFISIVALFFTIVFSGFNTKRVGADEPPFVHAHIAAYFLSLLLCNCLQAVGYIMNARWVHENGVQVGTFCNAQGIINQAADIGTAIWILAIIFHTFGILFTNWKMNKLVLLTSLIIGWSVIGALVIYGPAAVSTKSRGQFYGIAGYWCWISPEYPAERITLGYLFIFLAASIGLALSTLIILRLRSNLVVHGWRVRFQVSDTSHKPESGVAIRVKRMLPFPIAYVGLILPITTARILEWTGHHVAFAGLIFCTFIYLLSGLANAVLFLMIRRILYIKSSAASQWNISQPRLLHSDSFDFGTDRPHSEHHEVVAAVRNAPTMRQSGMTLAPSITTSTTTAAPPLIKKKAASATVARFPTVPPAPLFRRSESYDSTHKSEWSELSLKHSTPPEGVPTDIDESGRDSMESLYTDRAYLSPMDEVQLSAGKRVPAILDEYLSPRWN